MGRRIPLRSLSFALALALAVSAIVLIAYDFHGAWLTFAIVAQVGILTDGDGLFKIWGPMAANKYAKVMPFLGQQVEITGTEVTLSNNYDVRSFDLQTVKRKGK